LFVTVIRESGPPLALFYFILFFYYISLVTSACNRPALLLRPYGQRMPDSAHAPPSPPSAVVRGSFPLARGQLRLTHPP